MEAASIFYSEEDDLRSWSYSKHLVEQEKQEHIRRLREQGITIPEDELVEEKGDQLFWFLCFFSVRIWKYVQSNVRGIFARLIFILPSHWNYVSRKLILKYNELCRGHSRCDMILDEKFIGRVQDYGSLLRDIGVATFS